MNNWANYTGFQWLLIDVASRYGNDKDLFDVRIKWAEGLIPLIKMAIDPEMLTVLLQPYIDEADDKPMFCGAILAVWDALNGKVSNWQVGQDAASSGPQLLSVLLKDIVGMRHTGVLGKHVPDLYTAVTEVMNTTGKSYPRKIVKKGIIPHVYASEAEPKRVFGKAYPRFLKAYKAVVPKAQEATDLMVASWNSHATEHSFTLPDGAISVIPVIAQNRKNMPCGKHSFEFIYNEIASVTKGKAGTKSLAANTTHGYDAYMLRELNRRCNYNREHIERCIKLLARKDTVDPTTITINKNDYLLVLENLYYKFNQPSAIAFEYIDEANVHHISDDYAQTLMGIAHSMLANSSFEVTNIHDEFKSLPNYVSYKKKHYNRLLCETYMSDWWTVTASELSGSDVSFMANAVDTSLIPEILEAPYAIG